MSSRPPGRGSGGRGRFFRGRFNWYNKRGSRGRSKSDPSRGPPEVDAEDGLRNRSNDCEEEGPSDPRRNEQGPSRKRKSHTSRKNQVHNNSTDDVDVEAPVRPRQNQSKIESAIRAQWEVKYPGYKSYFGRDPILENFTEKLDAARDYLTRVVFQTESEIVEMEDKEYYNLNYLDLVGDERLMEAWVDLPLELQNNPRDVLSLWGLALHGIVSEAVNKAEKENSVCEEESISPVAVPCIRLGIIRPDPVTPLKTVKASYLGKYSTVRGAIVRTGTIKSYCIRMTFRCLRCRESFVVDQLEGCYTPPKICKASEDCDNKNDFEPVLAASTNKVIDYRRIRIQDMENSHLEQGRIPRTIDCDVFYELVNQCNAGDIVTLSGIVKMARETSGSAADQSLHNLYIEVFALKNHRDAERTMGGHWFSFTNKDYYAVKEIFETEHLFRLLVASVCPSIFGMEPVKAGILLTLFGGTHHSLEMLERRSDINILLVGDPGLGKSQILKMVSEVAPRGVYICGTGSTTAGLTVTLVRDGDEYSLEAGALVMADRGVCCIDEFDKMQSQHNALLEAMEQQCVTVAKSGVFRTIPARTSVVAAANPVGGHYDNSRSVTENIKINAPLLSRFDLTFILQDKPDEIHDQNLVKHIMGPMHDAAKPGSSSASDSQAPSQLSPESLLARLQFSEGEEVDIIPHHLLRKYIAYAKQYVHPKISPEAAAVIKDHYLDLRQHHRHVDSTPVTTRQLESLMRLTEARAKAELREVATEADAKDVLEIFQYSMRGVYDNDKDITLGFTQDVMDSTLRSLDLTPSAKRSLSRNQAKRLAGELERVSHHLSKALFTIDEIKAIAQRVDINSGVEKLIDTLNIGGHLLKKGPKVYEFTCAN